MLFYLGELVAIAVCWLFYWEISWMMSQKAHKACSNEYINRRCVTFTDKLFMSPLKSKADFGPLYYVNVVFFFALLSLSVFHILFGWIELLHGFLNVVTTVLVIALGLIGAAGSAGSSAEVCAEKNILERKKIVLIQAVVFISEILVILTYLYLTWVYILI